MILETLLADIPGPAPAGSGLPDRALFEIERARHSQDAGGGVWEREAIEPDWDRVLELTSAALAGQSKHLKLAAWFTEANTHLNNVPGFTGGLRLITELIERFWDRGLLPAGDVGDYSSRAMPIEGLNDRICVLLNQVPLTEPSETRQAYCYPDYKHSIRPKDDDGVTREMWAAAVKNTERSFYEKLSAELSDARESMAVLMKVMDEKFGDNDAPSLREIRELIEKIQETIAPILIKDKALPVAVVPPDEQKPEQETVESGSPPPTTSISSLDLSVEGMTALAAQENGRNRFLRRLALAELCLTTKKEALAVIILEELTEQIKTQNLALWESSELIGRVWGQLYRQYRLAGDAKKAAASEMHLNLCRLDPWQGLRWSAD